MAARTLILPLAAALFAGAMTPQAMAQGASEAQFAQATGSDDSSILARPARLNVADVPLQVALSTLSEISQISIAFSPSFLPKRVVGCDCDNATVAEALEHLLAETDFTFFVLDDQVVVALRKPRNGTRESHPAFPTALYAALDLTPKVTTQLLQEGTVTGRVVEGGSGTPLASVPVSIVGSSIGSLTDDSGNYTLNRVPAGQHELRAERIGFLPAQRRIVVSANETLVVNFELQPHALRLGELIVSVGPTDARRVELGTDIERIDASLVVDRAAIANLSDLLKSRAPGVSISPGSGEAGTASKIRVRGATSLTQSNNPIMFVDGIRVNTSTGSGPGSLDFADGQTISRLDDLNPQDIASIQIMKGPTAAALYGSEAASGVILVETKRGTAGGHQLTFRTEQGFSEDRTTYPDNYFNLTRFGGFSDINEPMIQQFRPVQNPATGEIYARHNPLEDPRTSPFRKGMFSMYDLSLRGGSERINYFNSIGYQTREGVLPNNGLERVSLRSNVDVRPIEKVQISVRTNFVRAQVRLPDNDRSGMGYVTNAGAGLPIFSRGTRADGSPGDCLGTVIQNLPESVCDAFEGNLTASFDKLATVRNEQDVGRFMGSIIAEFRPLNWFANRVVVGTDYSQTRNFNLIPLDPDRPFGGNSAGLVRDVRIIDQVRSLDYGSSASWNPSAKVSALTSVGAQLFDVRMESTGCTGDGGFASTTANACDAALTFTGSSGRSASVEVGTWLQQQFGYDQYFFVTAGIRRDDNSAFGEEQGAIWSPSVNLSAVLSDMPFWKLDWLDYLRLRLAWGTAAQAPAPFAHVRTYRPVRLEQDGTQRTGISPLAPGNPQLTAERNEELEFGVDADLLDNRLAVKLTYYTQRVRDAIVAAPVAPSSGFGTTRWVNIGAVDNKGIEALVSAHVLNRQNVSWEVDLKVSTQDPIVTSLGGQPPILGGALNWEGMFREGYAPGSYYGPIVEKAERGPDGRIIPGSIVFAPGNLNDPTRPDDRYLGKPQPSSEQSLSTTVTLFNNVRIYTLFDRAAGLQKNNSGERFRTPFRPEQSGSRKYAFREVESTPEEQAMMELRGPYQVALFIEDADWIKWRELTLTYQLPRTTFTALGPLNNASITLGARNLATWSSYSGLDPEVSLGGGTDSFVHAEFFTLPPARMYFAKMDVTF